MSGGLLLLDGQVYFCWPSGKHRAVGRGGSRRGNYWLVAEAAHFLFSRMPEWSETILLRNIVITVALMEQLPRESPSVWRPFSWVLGLDSHKPSICWPLHPPIHPPTHPFTYPPPISQPIHSSSHTSTQIPTHLPILSPTHPSIH